MKSPDDTTKTSKPTGTAPLDLSKLSFGIGRPLSEEEFKAMCRSKNMTPQIHRVDSQKK